MLNSKPRDVQTLLIATDTKVLRSRTWDRLKFEVEYSLQRGTSANSYLIQAEKAKEALRRVEARNEEISQQRNDEM